MDLKKIAEDYQLVYEKKKLDPVGKEDDDVDNDGDVDSSDEYLKKRRAAIGKAMGKDGDKEEDEEEKEDKKKDKKESLDLVSAYNSMYEHHQKDADGNVIPHEDEDEEEVKEGIDLSFVDELSEEELDILVEEVVQDLLDEGIEIDAIEGAFTVYLEEAKVTYGSDTEDPMVAAVKKRKEEKAKASKEKAEKFKKSVGKAVTGIKAKMHGGMADYASKRKLIPTKGAKAAAATPERVAPAEPKNKTKKAQKEFEIQKKGVEMANKSRAEKMKKTQTAGNIKNTMKGSGAKQARKELRSAVFKDVKDRVKGAAGKVKSGVKGMVKSARNKTANVLFKMADKIKKEGRELDMFDTVTAYLIDEGLVKDFDHAQRVMTTLDSTLIEEVHAEQMQLLEAYGQDKPGYGKGGDFSKVPTSLHGKMKVVDYDIKHNTEAGKRFKAGNPAYKKESLEDAYLQVYAEKLDPMDFGKSKRTKEEKKKARDKKKMNMPPNYNVLRGEVSQQGK